MKRACPSTFHKLFTEKKHTQNKKDNNQPVVWSYGHGSPLQHLLSCGWLAAFPCSPSSSLISPLKPLTSHNTSTIDHGFINKLRWVPIWIIIMEGGALSRDKYYFISLFFSFSFVYITLATWILAAPPPPGGPGACSQIWNPAYKLGVPFSSVKLVSVAIHTPTSPREYSPCMHSQFWKLNQPASIIFCFPVQLYCTPKLRSFCPSNS